jgi:hypothetical protein
MMGGLSRKLSEDTEAKAGEGVEITDINKVQSLANNTGQSQQHVQKNYLNPDLTQEQAQENLREDLGQDLNPELENTELVPQLTTLLVSIREKTGEAADEANKTLGAGVELLKKTKDVKLTPIWKAEVTKFVSLLKKLNAEPENKEIAEQARMRAGVVAENHSMYLDLQNGTDIPKEKIDGFMDRRAATEAKSNKKRQFVALPS